MKAQVEQCLRSLKKAGDEGLLPPEFLGVKDKICKGAVRSLDVECFGSPDEWARWLAWASVLLDEKDYLKAAAQALKLAPRLAATDYGTARQRDLGQLWTDTIRGFLGEVAFAKWLQERFGMKAELDFRKGRTKEFLPSDLRLVEKGGVKRAPKLRISIKTVKMESVWLDIPYGQAQYSDVFVLVRVGVAREHFLAFLKTISAIKKMLNEALSLEMISKEEFNEILMQIPNLGRIPAYVAGFLDKGEYGDKLEKDRILCADGRVSRRGGRSSLIVSKFLGFWDPSKEEYKQLLIMRYAGLERLPEKAERLDIVFEGIKSFSRTLHFLANSGFLRKKSDDWKELVERL